jgi:hypothetical protein
MEMEKLTEQRSVRPWPVVNVERPVPVPVPGSGSGSKGTEDAETPSWVHGRPPRPIFTKAWPHMCRRLSVGFPLVASSLVS